MSRLLEQLDDKIDYFEVSVTDIERAKAFFGQVFGWTFTDYGENYCEFSDGRIKGGFALADHVQFGGALIVLYHHDLAIAQSRVVAGGGKVSKERFGFPGGERFQFIDPEGHEWAVWCKDQQD